MNHEPEWARLERLKRNAEKQARYRENKERKFLAGKAAAAFILNLTPDSPPPQDGLKRLQRTIRGISW